MTAIRKQIVLASRPNGAQTPDDFRLEEIHIFSPEEDEAFLASRYLSLEPYMHGRSENLFTTGSYWWG